MRNPSYEDIDSMTKTRTSEERTETSNSVPVGRKNNIEGNFLAQAPSGVHVSPREILKNSDATSHAEQQHEEKEIPKYEDLQGIDSVSKLGDQKKETMNEDFQSEEEQANLCIPAANDCLGNKKPTNENSKNDLDSASDNIITSEDKNAPKYGKNEENIKDDAAGYKKIEEGIHKGQWHDNLLIGLDVVKLAETSLLGDSFQHHEPADTVKNAEENEKTEVQHMSKDVENIPSEDNNLLDGKEGPHGPINGNKELAKESSHAESDDNITKSSEEREEQEKDTQQGKQNFLRDSTDKDEKIEEQSFLPAKQVSEETSVHDKEISDPKKRLENDVQEEEKAAEESYITTSISELDKEMLSAVGAEQTLIHEEVSDSLKDKGQIQDELETDVADSNVTKHEMQVALEVNAEESLIVNETKSGEYNKPEMFDYKEDAKRNAKVHDESCNSSSHGPLNEASAHDNKERNSETKIEEIVNEASNQENLELGNTKDGKGSNLVGNIDSDPNKPEIRLQILELQNQISGEDENAMLFNMKESLEVTKGVDHDCIIVKKNNEGKEATEPGHLILNEVEKLEKSSHVSSDEIPKPSEPDNKQENKVMKNKEDLPEVQQSKDKHEIREEQKNVPANQVSEDETFHNQESIDSRKAPEKYVQEEKEAKESIKTLSIPESFKKTDSALESKETENSKGVPNFLKDKDQNLEALVKDVQEEKAGEESTNILSILESYKKTDSALKAKEKKNSEEVSNFLKDKDQIQDEPDKDVADTHETKYDSHVAPKVNAEISKENEATTGAEHNKLEMLEDEEDANRSAEIHDGSCNSSSHSLLNKGSKHEDTERDCKTRVKKIVNEAVNQEKLEGNVKDGSECNQVDNFEGVPKVPKISQRILKPQKEIANKDKMTLEMEERHQEVTEENDQDLSVMKQKSEGKEANESGQLTINMAEHEESSYVASDENISKPSKPSNKQETEALVRKNGHFEEDQQTMDKDETKEELNLVLFNEVSEETIIHDQGTEDSGTKVQEEEKVVTPSISESNKETDSAIGEKETENSEEVSNLMKDKDQIQEEFHKDVVDTHVSKYDVQETLETNAEERFTGNEAVTGTEKNDLGILEDEKDANIKAKVHDDSYNGNSNGLLKKASEYDDTERDPEPKKVENVDEAIEEEQLDLVNIQEGRENNKVCNFDVVANLYKITNLESQKKIAGKNKMILEERLQEATEEVDQDLSVMKQKNKNKETIESGQLIVNMDEECEECVASEECIPELSETRKKQEKEAVEREGDSLEEDQQTENKDERKVEQNLIPVNEISEKAIIHDQGTEDSGKGVETKVREEEKVDTEGSVTPSIPELNKETVSAIGEEETENSEKASNFLKDKNRIQDEFQKDAVDTHVSKYDVQEALETNAEERFTGNKTVTGTENNDIGMREDEEDANKRARVHDDSCNGSSNGLLTIVSEQKVTERDPEVKKVEKVVEAVKQEKLDLVNINDGRESNQVDKFDFVPNIAKISQQILAGKDEMILEERLQEAAEEIDQDLSVIKQKNEDKETTESGQLTVNEEEYEECAASEECIPKPSEPSNKQEKEAMEKKRSFFEEVQQTKEKDETREEHYHIPVNEISEEAIIHDLETSGSKKGLETKARAEEKVDKESTITPSNSEKNKEAESIKREKETENSEKVSNFLKDKNQIQDEFHKDVFDTHVAKYDVEESIETNADNSLTGNEVGKGTENIDLLEDEEDANKRSKVYDGSCNSPSNDLLNGTSEHEDKERDSEQKKEDIVDEATKQKKVDLGNIQDGRESNQVNDFDVVSDMHEISQQILEHQTEITGKDEKILEMKGVEAVNKEIDKQLYLTKPKYEASSTEPYKKETESSQLIVNVENNLEVSSRLASDENIPKSLKPNNKIEKEVREKNGDFFKEVQQNKDKDKTREEQNTIQTNQVSKEKIVPDQERSDSRKGLESYLLEEETEAKRSNISESNKEVDSAIGSKEIENFQKVCKFLKDKEHNQDELDKDVADNNAAKSDMQEAIETDAEASTTGKEAATMVNKSEDSDLPERPHLKHENKCQHQTQTRTWAEGIEQAKEKEENEAVVLEEMASEITYSIEHDERGYLEGKGSPQANLEASPQTNSEGKQKEGTLKKNFHDATEGLQIELRNDIFYEDAHVKQYANDNIEESCLKGKDEILLKARAEWKSNNIPERIHSYDTKDQILPDEEIETKDAKKDLQNEDPSYKRKEVPCSCLEEEKMERVQENVEEIREKNSTAAALENESQQKREELNVSLHANQIYQMELKKQTTNRSDEKDTDDGGLKSETSTMLENSMTVATKEEKNSMPLQGKKNHAAIKLNETTRHGTPTRENETDSSSGKHKLDQGVEADIASIVMSAAVFCPNKSAAKNDGVVISKTDDDPYEVPAHIKETTHIDDKRDGAVAESSMQSQGRQQHQEKQVYESITEGKSDCIELEEIPIKNQALGTMKDMLNAQMKKLPHRSIEEQEIDKGSRERVHRIQNACDEVDKSIDYNEIESKLVGQNSDTDCSRAKMIIDQTTCMTANEGHKKEVTDDISHKIVKNTVAEQHISEAAVSCLEDERTDEKLQDDGNKNKKTEQILTEKEQELKASDATERKVSDDKIKESMSSSSEEKLAVTGFSEKMNPKGKENSSKKLDFHQVIASLEETTQQEGDVLFVPKTNAQRNFETGTEDEEHFKEGKRDCRTISSEIKDVEDTYAHESNESDEVTPIEATKSQSSNGTLMTETKCQEGNKKKTDETGLASEDDTGKEYSSAGIGKHEKNLQSVSVVSQQVATSPSEEMDMLQPSKEVHDKIIEVGKFNDEKNQPAYNDFAESRFLLDPILREDKLNKSHVLELESKPKEKNEMEKIDASIKEQITTALLPSEHTSEKKCTSDETEAQNFEQFTDIKQEEKNNNEPKGTANTFPSSEHASIERDTTEEAATEYQKIEQTTNSMQDEKNNDVKEDKINMITIKDGTQDSNIYDSSVVTPARVGVENAFSCNNPFPGISNKHTISSTSQLTTLEQVQIFIDDLEDTDLVQGEKDNEVNLENQIKERGIHEVKESPQEGFRIPSNIIVPDDDFSYEEDGNEKEVLQNAGNFNRASNAIPLESSPLIAELNKKVKKLVQREVNLPTCESTEHSVPQEAKLHGIMNVDFKIKRIESAELNPIQVLHSEAQDAKNVSSKMNLADTLNIQNTEIENFGTCKKEGEKSVLARVEENEKDREKDEKEEREDCADRTVQVAEEIVEDCMLVSKGEKGNIETTINQVGGDNNDEERDQKEEEEGHKDEEPGYEASINVDSRVVVKPTHKKSHNILSGVGSKVKHSIAKVKKVITCKSLHSKTST